MNGGKHPVRDGDYLLPEARRAGSITGDTMVIERQDDPGDNQYLLRKILKNSVGQASWLHSTSSISSSHIREQYRLRIVGLTSMSSAGVRQLRLSRQAVMKSSTR